MNHRELILSADKKARFEFLALPESLQDAIIDGLDGQTLTLMKASALLKEKGVRLSHEAIASYYRAVRRERRLFEMRGAITHILAEYGDQGGEDGLRTLQNIAIATAITGIADGSVGIKDIDLARLVKAMNEAKPAKQAPATSAPVQAQPGEQKQTSDSGAGLSNEAADEIRKKVLGIK